jgi:hypothetical protein
MEYKKPCPRYSNEHVRRNWRYLLRAKSGHRDLIEKGRLASASFHSCFTQQLVLRPLPSPSQQAQCSKASGKERQRAGEWHRIYGAKQSVCFTIDAIGKVKSIWAAVVSALSETKEPQASWRVAAPNVDPDFAEGSEGDWI